MSYSWLNEDAVIFLSRGYLSGDINKNDVIDRIEEIISNAESRLPFILSSGDGVKLEALRNGVKRGWVSFSTPIWANFGKAHGLPASCNGSFMADDIDSIVDTVAEIGKMTARGAGTSCYLGSVRPSGAVISTGGTTGGPLHFARLIQETVAVISQSNIRRGACAIWLNIDHKDIDDWLNIRSITDGVYHAIQHLPFGVCISDQWMREMLKEERGGEKRLRMVKIINRRRASGYPYIFFTDNANKGVEHKEDIIYASNLCTEIMLPSNVKESFVCVLSSINLEYFEDWKEDYKFISEIIMFLLTVNHEYIEKARSIPGLERAVYSAQRRGAIGLGVLGYHSYLQKHSIAFCSDEARNVNKKIFSTINEAVTKFINSGELRVVPWRTLAVAPTTSSSFILGQTSPSIEPWESNYFENDLAKGVFTHKNKHLEILLESRGCNVDNVWQSILKHGGSVQHLDILTPDEKNVFKTFGEIDQMEIIQQAADRQPFIDQGQSLNLKIDPKEDKKYNVNLIVSSWKKGLKSLYYHKGYNSAQELNITCSSCEA